MLVPCVLWFFLPFLLLELTIMALASEAVALVRFGHIPELFPSEFVGFNLTKPLGELRICAHFKNGYDEEVILLHICGVSREPFVLFLGDKLGHLLPDCLLAVEYCSPSVC